MVSRLGLRGSHRPAESTPAHWCSHLATCGFPGELVGRLGHRRGRQQAAIGIQMATLPYRMDVQFLDSFREQYIEPIALAVRRLVESVDEQDRLRDEIRNAWEDSVFGRIGRARYLAGLDQLRMDADRQLSEAIGDSNNFSSLYYNFTSLIVRPVQLLESELIGILESRINDASRRVLRLSKMLDEGIRPREIPEGVYYRYREPHASCGEFGPSSTSVAISPAETARISPTVDPNRMVSNRPTEGLHPYPPGGPTQGSLKLRASWLDEVMQRWLEIGPDVPFPVRPQKG